MHPPLRLEQWHLTVQYRHGPPGMRTCVHCRQHALQIDKPSDAAIDVVNLSSNGKVGAGDVAGSSSALPFDQLHMVNACCVGF